MTKTDGIAIKVQNVSKTFKLPHERKTSLKSLFVGMFKSKRSYEKQKVLTDISFEIKQGEFFGIVGRNGSGKSTLLKLMAGIYTPDSGKIGINGKLTPFIELGVGFNPELTGRENVFLNGALLGFNRKEMEAMYEEIVEFAELEKFMDQKLKNYSSGMQVRLAFSIAIRAKGDVLLLDEVLAVGDAAFQQKCFDYFEELKSAKKTVILVSHDKLSLERFCERGILIQEGEIIESGPISKVLRSYNKIILDEIDKNNTFEDREVGTTSNKRLTDYASIFSTKIYDTNNKEAQKFQVGEKISASFRVRVIQDIKNPILGLTVWQKNVNKPVFAINTFIQGNNKTGEFHKGSTIKFSVELPPNLNNGEYYLEPAIANESVTIIYDQRQKAAKFTIYGSENPYSILHKDTPIVLTSSSP